MNFRISTEALLSLNVLRFESDRRAFTRRDCESAGLVGLDEFSASPESFWTRYNTSGWRQCFRPEETDCCAAGFQFCLCRLRVISVGRYPRDARGMSAIAPMAAGAQPHNDPPLR